jgi:hypothetical protein
MGCNEFVLMEQLYDRISRIEPEALANQCERHGVQRLLVDDVSVRMDLDFGPYSQHRRNVRQRREQRLLDGKARQRLLAYRAMFARAGPLHDPFEQLPVGIGQVAERAQRHRTS